MLAGLAGGFVASWAMVQTHAVLLSLARKPAQQSQGEDSTVKAARSIARPILDRELTPAEAKAAGPIVHYAFGSSVAAAYGAAAELAPVLTRGVGLPFGTAVWMGAHVTIAPALGFSPPVTQSPASSEVAEFVAHLVYGAATELIRRGVRRMLGR